MPEPQPITMNRPLAGWLALLCWISAAGSMAFEGEQAQLWLGVSTRLGLVLTALWMAIPKDGRLGNWANLSITTLIAVFVAMFVVVRNPRQWIPVVIGVVVLARMLRPKDKSRPPRAI